MPPSSRDLVGLPAPSEEESAVSEALTRLIREEIQRSGPIPFARFMERALYEPGFGYYAAGKQKLGESGDFITAPESFPVFGSCMANAVADVLQQMDRGNILEVGAGSGRLAATLLDELSNREALPPNYFILDLSADLRERQAKTIESRTPSAFGRVQWLDRLPAGFRGIVIANELLDAMPVEKFIVRDEEVRELRVGWQEERFVWIETPANDVIGERVRRLELAPGYESEIGIAAEAWIRSVADILEQGLVLLVDYGYPHAEFYHPDRSSGTLMCHYHHRAHPDPLILVGLQDITAHIDFTAIAEAGTEAGLDLLGYTSQAAFLIGSGLQEIAARSNPKDTRQHLALTEQIKKLTLPHEMGELYKVLALGRNTKLRLPSFTLQDRRHRL